MLKRTMALLILMVLVTTLSILLAYRNSKPVCEDLVRADNGHLICVFDLGYVSEDSADVIMAPVNVNYTTIKALTYPYLVCYNTSVIN